VAATLRELQDLHRKVAESLTKRISQDMEDEVPTDAAIKFLKDTNVSADPADKEDLNGLRDQLAEARKERARKREEAMRKAKEDILQATGG
jgi:hypothetical protein